MLLQKRDISKAKDKLFYCMRDTHEQLFGSKASVTQAQYLESYSAQIYHDGVGDRLALETLGLLLNKVIHVYLYSLGEPEWSTRDYSDLRESPTGRPLRLFLTHDGLYVLKPMAHVNQSDLCPCTHSQEHYKKD